MEGFIAGLLIAVLVVAALTGWISAHVTVMEFERGLRYRSGRFTGVLTPGRYLRGPKVRIEVVDVRPQQLAVQGQEVLTADLVSLKISLAVRMQVVEPAHAVNEVGDYRDALYTELQLALRAIVAQLPVEELLARREEIGVRLREAGDGAARPLGLELLGVDVKDVMFPGDLKRTFAQVAAARQEGQAAVERARGETAALRHLANSAKALERNPSLLQLRLVQQLGASTGHTVVLSLAPPTAGAPTGVPGAEGR